MARSRTTKLAAANPRKSSASFTNRKKENVASGTTSQKVTEDGLKSNKKDRKEVKFAQSVTSLSKEDVLALGGDTQDYEDLKDVDSDADLESTSQPVDVKLSKEVSALVKSLKIYSKYKDAEEIHKDATKENLDSGENIVGTSPKVTINANVNQVKEQLVAGSKAGPSKGKAASRAHLIIEPSSQWYSIVPPLADAKTKTPTNEDVMKLQAQAEMLFKMESDAYASSDLSNALTSSSSDKVFLQQILTSGTLSDRLSALTLMAQSSPAHNTKALESLKSMAQKKGREESLKALRAIVDWWSGGGAPDRKLKHFREQPLLHPSVSDSNLFIWYFEDWLKKYFFGIIQTLETLSLDPLPYVRMQTISLIFTLLREKPEQEQNLLHLLVNKLGDSEKQVASRASYHLLLLLQSHPQMKSIVVKEVASLLLRPPSQKSSSQPPPKTKKASNKKAVVVENNDLQRSHSQYYGSITLNQITLLPNDHAVAVQLLNVYFDLFKEILGEDADRTSKEEDHDKEDADLNDEADSKKVRRGHSKYAKKGKSRNKGQKETGFPELEDSRSKLVSAILTGVNRAFPFAKQGVAPDDLLKRIDIMFRITHTSTFNISIQALRFILNFCTTIAASSSSSSSDKLGSIPDRYYRALYSSLEDSRLATSSKQSMYLNLLFKSLKVDKDKSRVESFVRRFVQLLWCGGSGGAEFAAGGLYLLAELFKYEPGLRAMFGPRSTSLATEGEDFYDPRKRDPKFANASSSPLWEFTPLLNHYHPTVRLYATQLIANEELKGSADLTLNTLTHFLDRFVYKNAKKPKPRGMSAMQPAAMVFDTTSVRVTRGNAGGLEQERGAVNEEWFVKQNVEDVAADEIFYHQFFTKRKKHQKDKDVAADADEESIFERVDAAEKDKDVVEEDEDMDREEDADSDESEIWEAIKKSIPKPAHDDNELSADEDDDDEISLPSMSDSDDDDDGDDGDDDDDDEEGEELFRGFAGLSDEDEVEGDQFSKKRTREIFSDDDDSENQDESKSSSNAKSDKNAEKKKKKKMLRSLPTFASYADYADMVDDEAGLE